MTQARPSRESKAEQMILALLESRTLKDAAKRLNCHPRTLTRALRDKDFQEQYRGRKKELLEGCVNRLRTLSFHAVESLGQVSKDGDAWTEPVFYKGEVCGQVQKRSPSAKVAAAGKIVDLVLQIDKVEALEKRITELEKNLEESRES